MVVAGVYGTLLAYYATRLQAMNLLTCLNTVYSMLKTAPPRSASWAAYAPAKPLCASANLRSRTGRRGGLLHCADPFSELQHLLTHGL